MGRWEPGAAGRLRAAALELYVERGFEQTTVADIAERAGLTARTFFRHFADKREVLFAGSAVLQEQMVDAVEAAPESATPFEAVGAALQTAAGLLSGNRDYSRQRQAVIESHHELRERELIKMASLSAALAVALGRRGVADSEANLAAEVGIAVFRVAFAAWVSGADDRDLARTMRDSFDQVRALSATAQLS